MVDNALVPNSPLLTSPGAVTAPDGSADIGVAWHYGDPLGEQRTAQRAAVVVDRSHRFVIAIPGDERLTWLHTISSQHIAALPDGKSAENLSLDVNGRVEHHFVQTDLAGVTWIDTEADRGPDLLSFLKKMVFWSKAEPRDGNELAVLSLICPESPAVLSSIGVQTPTDAYDALALADGGFVRRMPWPTEDSFDLLVPREQLSAWWTKLTDAGAKPAGSWAFEALRVEATRPRLGLDTDDRTIPHEVHWIGGPAEHGAVHLDKGCYR
ncbi:MAG: folate-binding protein, partial [Rhodococcus sp. (in: high G+C Gram-positive bacteria)]